MWRTSGAYKKNASMHTVCVEEFSLIVLCVTPKDTERLDCVSGLPLLHNKGYWSRRACIQRGGSGSQRGGAARATNTSGAPPCMRVGCIMPAAVS